MHDTKSLCLRALVRLPVVIPIWFLAIIFPFFGPINSAVGALLVSFTVYIIPALAHILTYRSASARQVKNSIYFELDFNPNWSNGFLFPVVECIGETSGGVGEELDGDVCGERVHSHVGSGRRIRVRRVGQYGQFHQTS